MKEQNRDIEKLMNNTKVDSNIVSYALNNVLPKYDSNIGGHGKDHIITVIYRSFEIIKEFGLDVDPKLIFIAALYHDIGYKKDPDNHEAVSSEMFLSDDEIKTYFTEYEIRLISDAIVDHRASLEYEARNICGKILSSADRETSVENMLKRSFLYQLDKHQNENPSVMDVINYSYEKLSKKYGRQGYAKMYYPDKKYTDFLEEMRLLIENKPAFVDAEVEISKTLGLKKDN